MEFATKPKQAQRMLARLLGEHGREALPWFTADEAYGDNPGLRDWLDEEGVQDLLWKRAGRDHRGAGGSGPVEGNAT